MPCKRNSVSGSCRWSEQAPADIRAQNGISQMSERDVTECIIAASAIPVMTTVRITGTSWRRGSCTA
ncbi:hypothetical protein KL953_29410 [Mycolicibacterium goodii]|uniref:hypothetical protein n=1 Tax=Mycolicibacterium goodii TaxID=134601 RepID=UPI001BDD21D5|nr:hypothetical protein [Mycolicibacterium goodii]